MSSANVAYLSLVGIAFGAFMVALSYGYLRCKIADRREAAQAKRAAASASAPTLAAEPLRKAA